MKKIKICGLKRREDIEYVNKYQPDYIGFVFAGKKRKLTYNQAVDLKKYLISSIQVVGVFVNEDISFVEKLVKEHVIDLVQLHGQEDQKYIQALKEKVDVPIIKAIQIKNEDSFNEHYDVDYYLYDHGTGGTEHPRHQGRGKGTAKGSRRAGAGQRRGRTGACHRSGR